MIALIIDYFLLAMLVYIILGLLFAIYFVLKGASKLDDGVQEAPWHFRLMIFPGSVLLWAVLLFKLSRKKS